MSDTKTPDGKTLSVGGKSTLSLKPRTETGTVRQSFSHGRSKQVVVEVKKRRGGDGKPEAAAPAPAATPAPAAKRAAPVAPAAKPSTAKPGTAKPGTQAATPAPAAPAPKSSGVVLRTLTDEERNRRAH